MAVRACFYWRSRSIATYAALPTKWENRGMLVADEGTVVRKDEVMVR